MRRQIIILIAAVLVTSAAWGGYPPEYYGDPMPDGCFAVEAWISEYHDMNPWSMPDPTGVFFLLGEACVDDGVLDLVFTDLAWRRCREAPWGTIGDPPICVAWWVAEWRSGKHKLAWEDGGFYYSGVWLEDRDGEPVFYFDSMTWDASAEVGRFVQGVWYIEATIFMRDDDRFTRTVWTVQPRSVPIVNAIRRSAGRVGR